MEKKYELVNKVPALVAKQGWSNPEFAARCVLAGIGQDTAYRLLRGETNIQTETLRDVARVLGVKSITDLIDIKA